MFIFIGIFSGAHVKGKKALMVSDVIGILLVCFFEWRRGMHGSEGVNTVRFAAHHGLELSDCASNLPIIQYAFLPTAGLN